MARMQMDALFTIVRGTLAIGVLTLLSACVNTSVNVTCPSGSGSENGPGVNCSLGQSYPPQNTLVSSIPNVVTIPANQPIPPGATCYFNATQSLSSTICGPTIPGQPCGFTPGKKCRDTYTISNSKCACLCNN